MADLISLILKGGIISVVAIGIIVVIFVLPQAVRILREYERGVIFRLGKLQGAKGPGLILLIPIIDKMVRWICAW
jgi:regulator of protease activity HflC (stomatin/prohibitin superfamily)